MHAERDALLGALAAVVGPLAQLCVARGMTAPVVEELVRRAFVEAARAACSEAGRQERLTSRISAMTGLTRREVARIEEDPRAHDLPTPRTYVTELLTRWLSAPEFTNGAGRPLRLPRTGPTPSFEALASQVTRDVHPATILAELQRLRLVEVLADGEAVALLADAFVPRGDRVRMLGFLGENTGDHLRAAVTNVNGTGTEHFDQALLADELSAESIEKVRGLITEQWRILLTTLGPRLEALMQADAAEGREATRQVRIGLYSWTQDMPAAPPPDKPGTE